jgi:hypothetical protein
MPDVGYEVLDSDGAGTAPLDPPPQVVRFDDLPEPGSRTTARPSWLPRPTALPRSGWALLVVAALAGGLVGGAITGARATGQAQDRRDVERRATLAVFALATTGSARSTREGVAVEVSVAVLNQGPETVTLVESPARPPPTIGRSVVNLLSGPARIGTTHPAVVVTVRTVLDCATDEPLQVQVPIRTNDGKIHPVGAVEGGADLFGLSSRRLCPGSRSARLEARLTGSPSRPTLLLGNDSRTTVTVALDSGSGFTQTSSSFFSLTTRPALPIRLAPGQRRELTVDLELLRCFNGTPDLATGLGVIGLRYERFGPGPAPDAAGATTVDLTPVLVTGTRRTCR